MKNWGDNVFEGIQVRQEEGSFFRAFLENNDLPQQTRKAIRFDLRKFCRWYVTANNEPFDSTRVTTSDIASFRDHLRRAKNQSVATVNRALCSIRKYLGWLGAQGHLLSNPAKQVKELRRQPLAPKGLERPQVRKLLREIELRGDIRAKAIFSLLLYTGARVSDVVNLELQDLLMTERSGSVVYRFGKGGKQRSVPLPLPARQAVQAYLESRPPLNNVARIFIGERGPLTDRGVRALCDKYAAAIGIKLHPHLLRHTMAKQFLQDSQNDLVALSQILGHESLTTTARYSQRTAEALAETAERMNY